MIKDSVFRPRDGGRNIFLLGRQARHGRTEHAAASRLLSGSGEPLLITYNMPGQRKTTQYLPHVRKPFSPKQRELLELRLAEHSTANTPSKHPPPEFFDKCARALIEAFGDWKAPSSETQCHYFTGIRGVHRAACPPPLLKLTGGNAGSLHLVVPPCAKDCACEWELITGRVYCSTDIPVQTFLSIPRLNEP
jgi:hypothetical protein